MAEVVSPKETSTLGPVYLTTKVYTSAAAADYFVPAAPISGVVTLLISPRSVQAFLTFPQLLANRKDEVGVAAKPVLDVTAHQLRGETASDAVARALVMLAAKVEKAAAEKALDKSLLERRYE